MTMATTEVFLSSSLLSSTSTRLASRKYQPSRPKKEPRSPTKSQTFNDTMVDSFFVSSSSNVAAPSIIISRQDTAKSGSSSKKRYVSSFKTLVNSTNDKHTQRLNYISDSVMILKLSKERTLTEIGVERGVNVTESDFSHKYRSLTTSTSAKPQSSSSPETRLSPIMKSEIQRRRTAHHESSAISLTQPDLLVGSNPTSTMAMSTSNHPTQNSSLSAYANALHIGSPSRQRSIGEATSNTLLFTTERIKSNAPLSIRSTRTNIATSNANVPLAYLPPQQLQRQSNTNLKSRPQAERLILNRDQFDYPDPFTNCPAELLNRLSQLTKYQLETTEWEKKRRYTKKKPGANNQTQGKDSP